MIHPTIRHKQSIVVQNYRTATRTFPMKHKGEVKPTFVTMDRFLRDRYWRLGWVDITEEVTPHLELWSEEEERWVVPEGVDLPWERPPRQHRQPQPLPVEASTDSTTDVVVDPPAPAPRSEKPAGKKSRGPSRRKIAASRKPKG